MKPTRRDIIDDLQNRIWKGRIQTLDQLKLEISCAEYDGDEPIDEYEDVLFPMGWNTCDRCGALGDSELDFCWVDSFDWQDDNEDDQAILRAIGEEANQNDYCAICWGCIKELKEKGK